MKNRFLSLVGKLTSEKRPEYIAALLIGVGFGSFYLANLIFGKILSPEIYGHFGIFLSAIALAYSFGLLGVEQVLLRHGKPVAGSIHLPAGFRRSEWTSGILTTILLTSFFSVKYPIPALGWLNGSLLYGLFIGATAFLLRQVSYLRLVRKFHLAQIAAQSWRILLPLAALLMLHQGWLSIQAVALTLAVVIIAALLISIVLWQGSRVKVVRNAGRWITKRSIWSEAFLFSSTMVSLSILAQLDRLVLAKTMPIAEVGVYIFLLVIATGPFALIQSYIGFTLLPVLRHCHDRDERKRILRRAHMETLILSMAGTVIGLLCFFFLVRHHYDVAYNRIEIYLPLLCLGWIRAFYGIISARLGASAKMGDLGLAAAMSWLITGLAWPLCWYLGGSNPVHMALIMVLFWTLRLSTYLFLAHRAERAM